MRWELATRTFAYTWLPDPVIDAPTEIFVPAVQYPDGYRVELSAGTYDEEPKRGTLVVKVADERELVTLRLRPA
jgi:hypothetical protein